MIFTKIRFQYQSACLISACVLRLTLFKLRTFNNNFFFYHFQLYQADTITDCYMHRQCFFNLDIFHLLDSTCLRVNPYCITREALFWLCVLRTVQQATQRALSFPCIERQFLLCTDTIILANITCLYLLDNR